MSVFFAAMLLQYVISVKAGLVNHVQGTANVAPMETIRAGHSVKTGADGYVEILLRPGSFLRLGENSEAALNDSDPATVTVTILRGPALVEAAELTKDHPITVTTGNLTTKIRNSGIYRFENGVATVIQGKLQTGDSKLTYEKGWQIFYQDNYRARKTAKPQVTSLDVYSQARSGTIANANYSLASSLNSPAYSTYDIWLYSPYLRFYTFIPRSNYRSPYGYRYHGAGDGRVVQGNPGYSSPSNGNTGTPTRPTNTPVDNANSGGGGVVAPAPTASTPAGEQSTPAVYIESKSSPVGATTK